ncbi:ARPP-1 family domain-containing protein [Frigoriglobus tundricola]|uniref:ARG and Rhodanese-Phosphatase-superfamily-associated domain-containing protein n=1 Tax=Frigoriglobus tundricola TaxID=2774151 RepID=A0A6M5YQ24_9BACT|nr:DUF6569 family protein [Frigoriglobus tundricola]QJW95062.1 hypothetical protein FTUN_2588 [Frigoriglobus tundricola]
MNASRFAVGLVGLGLAGLWYFAGGAQPLPASQAAEPPRVAAPLAHENLSVYFVYAADALPDAKVMSLSEALERELAIVHETSNVNVLAVENLSPDHELFVQSGDIVKGGKQDRMAAADMLLPPKSGVVAMRAHCVEQGRWTGRGTEDARQFKSSVKCAVGNEMKIANYSGHQSGVWQTVSENQNKLNATLQTTVNAAASPTSFQLTLEAPAVEAKVAEYEAALTPAADRDGVVGVVFVVNGKVTGAEVYGSSALFRKAWPKLLNAAAVEAVRDRTDKLTAAPPSAREVERFLAYGATAEPAARGENQVNNESPNAPALNLAASRSAASVNFYPPARGLVVNANEQVVQATDNVTNGQPQFRRTGRVNIEGNDTTGIRLYRNPLPALPSPLAEPAPQAARPVTPSLPAIALANGTNMNRDAAPQLQAPPAVDGNRLSSSLTENSSTLMVESRDPARQNAVIHRSYLKK